MERIPLDWQLLVKDGKYRGLTAYATKREAKAAERAARAAGSTITEILHRPGKAHRISMVAL